MLTVLLGAPTLTREVSINIKKVKYQLSMVTEDLLMGQSAYMT